MDHHIPAISVRPVVLPAPGRGEDLQVRVSAPATGDDSRTLNVTPDDPRYPEIWRLRVEDLTHSLGGINGYLSTETTDESPARVALVQRLTWAFLRSALHPADNGWSTAAAGSLGRLESK